MKSDIETFIAHNEWEEIPAEELDRGMLIPQDVDDETQLLPAAGIHEEEQ